MRGRRSGLAGVLLMGIWFSGCGGGGSDPGPGTPASPVAPSIRVQPSSQEITEGLSATFTVEATGTAPLSYQWQRNGIDVGGNSASHVAQAVAVSDSGARFRVRVSNAAGQIQSAEAVLTVVPVSESAWYVSTSGDDANDGRSPATPWKTLDKVSATTFKAGDAILFRRGDVWREAELRVSASGSSGRPIRYGAYGSGARPGLFGSRQATGWISLGGDRWQSAASIPEDPEGIGYDGPEIFFERTDGSVAWGARRAYSAGLPNLLQEFDWTWDSQRIYVFAPSDPGTRYRSVEVPQVVNGVWLQDHDHITIEGLDIRYYADSGIYDAYETKVLRGLRVTDCEIAYLGAKGGAADYGLSVHHSDSYIGSNVIHDCGRRGLSLNLYQTTPITLSNVIIEHNHFHHGWHTTSLDAATTGGHTLEDIHFRFNLVEGDPSVPLAGVNPNSNHIYLNDESDGSGTVRRFFIYGNLFTFAHGSSVKIGEVDQVRIYNNTFYNFNPTLDNWQAHVYTSNTTHLEIQNNIFHSNSIDNSKACIKLDESNRANVAIDRNLYFQASTGQRFLWINGGTSYPVSNWEAYRGATGFDAHSPAPADPRFAAAPGDLRLLEGSPALGAGIMPDFFTEDYAGAALADPVDLGALQR